MSGALTALASLSTPVLQTAGATGLNTLLLRNSRSFGGGQSGTPTIIPDVVIEETETNRVTITQHPVASGSPINDHVYRMPATVTMRCGWTNANPAGSALSGFQSGGGFSNLGGGLAGAAKGLFSSFTEQRVKDVYKQLLKMQFDTDATGDARAVNTFQVTTGKKTYPAMVIAELQLRTDHTSEYALMLEVHFQEIIMVTTQSTTQPAQTNQGDTASQTAAPTDQGSQTPKTPETNPDSIGTQWTGIRMAPRNPEETLPGPGQ